MQKNRFAILMVVTFLVTSCGFNTPNPLPTSIQTPLPTPTLIFSKGWWGGSAKINSPNGLLVAHSPKPSTDTDGFQRELIIDDTQLNSSIVVSLPSNYLGVGPILWSPSGKQIILAMATTDDYTGDGPVVVLIDVPSQTSRAVAYQARRCVLIPIEWKNEDEIRVVDQKGNETLLNLKLSQTDYQLIETDCQGVP